MIDSPNNRFEECVSEVEQIKTQTRFRVKHEPFTFNNTHYPPGTYCFEIEHNKQTKESYTNVIRICDVLEVAAITRDREDGEYGKLLRFTSLSGIKKQWAMPMSMLAGQAGQDAIGTLFSQGLMLAREHSKLLLEYVAEAIPEERLSCATSTGWYDKSTFVLPKGTIGGNSVWFQSESMSHHYGTAGTLSAWKDLIAKKAVNNPNLIVAISCAFAGTLLYRFNVPSSFLHYFGDSTTGKTTLLNAACSVWGSPSFIRTWRATANGLEAIAAGRSDTLLVLDEIHEIDARELDHVVYMLSNGVGKARANRHGGAREAAQWRVLTLSSGEVSLAGALSNAGLEAKAGQILRFLSVPAAGTYGVFDVLPPGMSAAQLSDSIRDAAAQNYGHAGPEFVRELLAAEGKRQDVTADLIVALAHFPYRDEQERRAARMFAIIAVAGELAVEFGLAPWSPGDAIKAGCLLFTRWQDHREVGEGNTEHKAILRAVMSFIDRHGDSRFSSIDPPLPDFQGRLEREPIVRDRAGWWEDYTDSRIYLFTVTGLREATKGYDFNRALDALDRAGAITKKADGRRAVTRRTPGNSSARLYHVDPQKLTHGL